MSDPAPSVGGSSLPEMDVGGRLDRLRPSLAESGLGGLLVTNITNVRYLSGFTGSAGSLWVDEHRAVLVTDGRYRDQAPDQVASVGADVDVEITAAGRPSPVGALAVGLDRVGLEADSVSWAEMERLAGLITTAGGGDPVSTTGLVESLREVKDDGEVARIAAAAAIADTALASVEALFVAGAIESELATALDHAMRISGSSDRAFETIVAAGPNGARPHARPGSRAMVDGDLVVRDFGAVIDGYRSDMTRSMRVGGTGSGPAADLLAVVLEAQAAGLAVVADGVPASEVDRVCRSVLVEAGLGEAFSHGTGHGVGLDIHEAPAVASTATGNLRSGQVVTVEPGAYVAGLGGVRWEDTVLVTDDGHRPLTGFPKAL
ncbi:MAG: Xaa-Pro peptidase family protein [Actinomycetota bacterium]|nr:Xaa-Pro peptidase family protein [Actinomycetota bacterium]MED5233097.1 Xaa-Pro peptidase family protein [Actinomycetota bacterium]MEE3353303.1 Xaa-Pro peptidase family protein [Actinomycetota bacterium]